MIGNHCPGRQDGIQRAFGPLPHQPLEWGDGNEDEIQPMETRTILLDGDPVWLASHYCKHCGAIYATVEKLGPPR